MEMFFYESWDDIKKTINPLADAMLQEDLSVGNYCTDTEQKNKEACKLIVRGLKSIYEIKVEGKDGDKDEHKKNNRLFEQTMECFILNVYAELIKERCPTTGDTVQKAFTNQGNLHTSACAQEPCNKCKWEECKNMTVGKGKLWDRIKTELRGDGKMQVTLDKICQATSQAAPIPKKQKPERKETDAPQPVPGVPVSGEVSSNTQEDVTKKVEPKSKGSKTAETVDKYNDVVALLDELDKKHDHKNSNDDKDDYPGQGIWVSSGGRAGEIDVVQGKAQLPSGPSHTSADPVISNGQTPSTGTDTQNPQTSSSHDPGNNNNKKKISTPKKCVQPTRCI
ncbi:SICA antigen [Plasmodium coatneyi]|uniref:SICA antigen n=1 Tax=Plasmodium coatneyi TaxID=208452 RepID=A0A1B1E273_9APIC|nr:SICA antigen [Plasmodium coatneyi]ANQ09134.1 SICA antigen [Plasmodium coatneyi]